MAFATLNEFKTHLNIPLADTSMDTELQMHLDAADNWVAWAVGFSTSTAVTEDVFGMDSDLVLSYRPVTAVTAITSLEFAPAVALSEIEIQQAQGVLRRESGLRFGGWYEVAYTVGFVSVPAAIKLATLIIAQHLWQTQAGGGGLPPIGAEGMPVPSGFAIPNRALELLRPYSPPSAVPGIA